MLVQSQIVSIFNAVLSQKARLRKGGTQATYHCPFCIDKNLVTQKLEIAIGGSHIGNYHCWRCNTKGRTFGSLLKRLSAPATFREKLFQLTGDIRLARNTSWKEEKSDALLPHEFHPLSLKKNSIEYKNALAYLKKRGVTFVDIVRYNIGYCESGSYEHHLIFPSYDANGKLNFFIGRRYYEDDPGIPHKKPDVPMNIVGFESLVNYDEPVNVCEGVFDAIAIRNNAVPLFGKMLSEKLRIALILSKSKRVNMILDNDAMKDAVKNCKRLMQDGIEVHLVRLNGKDPSKIGFQAVHKLIQQSKPFDFDELIDYELGL